MQVEALQKVGLDPRGDAVAEQGAVGDDDGGPAPTAALEPSHDDLEKQERRLRRSPVVGKVVEDPCLFLAAEGRIGEDDVDPPVLADLGQAMPQRVARVDARRMEAVQKQVQLGEQVGQGLCLLAEDAALLDRRPVSLGPSLGA